MRAARGSAAGPGEAQLPDRAPARRAGPAAPHAAPTTAPRAASPVDEALRRAASAELLAAGVAEERGRGRAGPPPAAPAGPKFSGRLGAPEGGRPARRGAARRGAAQHASLPPPHHPHARRGEVPRAGAPAAEPAAPSGGGAAAGRGGGRGPAAAGRERRPRVAGAVGTLVARGGESVRSAIGEALGRALQGVPRGGGGGGAATAPPRPPPLVLTPSDRASRAGVTLGLAGPCEREIQGAAELRAACYYEADSSRFRETFERQFRSQEFLRLTRQLRVGGGAVACLVARDAGTGEVVGTLDVVAPRERMEVGPFSSLGRMNGAPAGEDGAAFAQNVCVRPAWRGRGVGRALMEQALDVSRQLGAAQCFVQVDGDNAAARRLYESVGFRPRAAAPGGDPDARVLLVCEL